MRFIDEAKIKVIAGHGGPGSVSFRRETFAPKGGPDGGDGGDGGSVTFISTSQLSTLQDFRFKREYKAENGHHGSGANKAGCDGEDVEIKIPVGTVIKDPETGEILFDFTTSNQKWTVCKGGKGGKGNSHFVSSTFQAPRFAQPGLEGESKEISLELKLIADVGIIGFPNAGKSTLISVVSAAKPKIADYAFTTRTPNLGVVRVGDYQSFTMADIPGLIEGAHTGAGLGHRFLKHIERTALFVHLIDGSCLLEFLQGAEAELSATEYQENLQNGLETLVEKYMTIRNELGAFNQALLHKPEIIAINKSDLFIESKLFNEIRVLFKQKINHLRGFSPIESEPYLISAAAKHGTQDLVNAVYRNLKPQNLKNSPKAVVLPYQNLGYQTGAESEAN